MSKLNKSRVQDLIQSYGANPKRWPKVEQQAGKAWLVDNPALAKKLMADAHRLDQVLDTAHLPAGTTALLQARILKAAKNTVQDGSSQYRSAQVSNASAVAANDTALFSRTLTLFSAWKAAAAVLVLTTGMGFGIGQMAAADTFYASAEALLSVSMQSEYVEADLYGDEL